MANTYIVDRCIIYADYARIGVGVTIEPNVIIGSKENPIGKLVIGDHVVIGHDSNIQARNLTILDYTKINNHTFLYGRQGDCKIGYNCWFGQNCIIDCEGGVELGNGVGVGAYSQLWSHIRHGDITFGCQPRFLHYGKLIAEDDVWFVGHCIVSPIHAKKRSMAMVGSVITKDMEENHIYGGSPAQDLTDKLGTQFVDKSVELIYDELERLLYSFFLDRPNLDKTRLKIIMGDFDYSNPISQFNVSTRKYLKLDTEEEIQFMKYLLPTTKFIPDYA